RYVTHYLRARTQEIAGMKRGPKPIGDHTMTPAERQARYRASHADGAPKIRYRKTADRRSRPQRWRDAVAELVELQGDYQAWGSMRCRRALPTARRQTRCARSAASTCRSFRGPSRRVASGGIET